MREGVDPAELRRLVAESFVLLSGIRDALAEQEEFHRDALSAQLRVEVVQALRASDRPVPSHPLSLAPFASSAVCEVLRAETGARSLLALAGDEAWPTLSERVDAARLFLRKSLRLSPALFPEPQGRSVRALPTPGSWGPWNDETRAMLRPDGLWLSVSLFSGGLVARVGGVFVGWSEQASVSEATAEARASETFGPPPAQPSSPGNM